MTNPPPCLPCGQAMTDRDIGNKDEFECRPCQLALSPLEEMITENGVMLVWSMTDRDYKALPYMDDVIQWVKDASAPKP